MNRLLLLIDKNQFGKSAFLPLHYPAISNVLSNKYEERRHVKKDTRPINVGIADIMIYFFRWPITALVSITHRVAGVVLFAGVAFALYALEQSLTSEAAFNELKGMMTSPLGKFITWGLLSALAFHFVAGIKHLIMDTGVGETLEGGIFGGRVTILFSVILILLAGLWVI